jgi:hypothetical protein
MRKFCFLLFICLAIPTILPAQEVVWKVGLHSFFDNTEFGQSSVQTPQSMSGTHLVPEIGLGWNKKHRIFAGLDVMHEFGSDRSIDYSDVIAYYEYDGKPFRFYMGAIPRRLTLDKYPRMFFQDSIKNYRPVINGVFWEYTSGKSYANVWLDWISRQTDKRRETFFMGWSGRCHPGIFYIQHFGYMFHFMRPKEAAVEEFIHDNGLILTSLGLDLAPGTGFEKLEINAGWSAGLERDRGLNAWNIPQGLLSELKVEYKGLGLFNTYYRGGRQQVFYNDHSNELYWGDPVYRSKEYNRADFYIRFIHTDIVQLNFTYSFHLTEKQIYHEQMFLATFDLDNIKNRKNTKKYSYLWDNWF